MRAITIVAELRLFVTADTAAKSASPYPEAAEVKTRLCEVYSRIREAMMGAVEVEVLARSDKFLQYAVDAEVQAEGASTVVDRAVWLLMAKSWLSLLPLIDGPQTQPGASEEITLAERLDRLRRLKPNSPS